MIGTDIMIRVVDIDRGRVRIDIAAPKEVTIFREEIVNRKKGEEGDAA